MRQVVLESETDWDGWRRATRALVLSGAEPDTLHWRVGGKPHALPDANGSFNVSRRLVSLAALAIQARTPERFALLYRLVWRANGGDLPEDDPDLDQARSLAFEVRAEAHRMRTHVRFMPVQDADGEVSVRCAFMTHRYRSGVSDTFIGSTRYRLVRQDGGLRIREKRCRLDFDNLHEQGRISIIL